MHEFFLLLVEVSNYSGLIIKNSLKTKVSTAASFLIYYLYSGSRNIFKVCNLVLMKVVENKTSVSPVSYVCIYSVIQSFRLLSILELIS